MNETHAILSAFETVAVLGFTSGGQWGGHNCSWGHGLPHKALSRAL